MTSRQATPGQTSNPRDAEKSSAAADPSHTPSHRKGHGFLDAIGVKHAKEAAPAQNAASLEADDVCVPATPLVDAGLTPDEAQAIRDREAALAAGKAIEADEGHWRRDMRVKSAAFTIWAIIGACVLTGVGIYLLNILAIPVGIILWTVVIIFCLRGVVNGLERHGVSRTIGTAIAYVLMIIVLGLLGFVLFSPVFGVGDQFSSLIQSAPEYIKDVSAWANEMYARYADVLTNDQVQTYLNEAMNAVGTWASGLAQQSASGVMAVGTGVANTFVALGFALVIAYWVLIDLPQLGREVKRLGGPKHEETLTMLHLTVTRVMAGYIKGTLLQCAIIGLGCGVLFVILKIPSPIALGVITGVLNIIPIIGPWLGGGLAAIVGLFVNVWVAAGALIGTIVIQQIVYTFVSPKIMSESVDVHPALTFLALMTGSAIGGAMSGLSGSLVGMLASIPFVAVAKSVFVYYFEKMTGRRIVSTSGVFFKGEHQEGTPTVNPLRDATGISAPPKPSGEATGGTGPKLFARDAEGAGSGESSEGKAATPVSSGAAEGAGPAGESAQAQTARDSSAEAAPDAAGGSVSKADAGLTTDAHGAGPSEKDASQ